MTDTFYEVNESPTDVGFEYTFFGDYDNIKEIESWLHEHYPLVWGIEWTVDHRNRHEAINVVFNTVELDNEAALMAFKLRWI